MKFKLIAIHRRQVVKKHTKKTAYVPVSTKLSFKSKKTKNKTDIDFFKVTTETKIIKLYLWETEKISFLCARGNKTQ